MAQTLLRALAAEYRAATVFHHLSSTDLSSLNRTDLASLPPKARFETLPSGRPPATEAAFKVGASSLP